jgi:hypothetical protein
MLAIEIVPHAFDLTTPHPFHVARNKLSPCEKERKRKERGHQVRKKEREKRGEKE